MACRFGRERARVRARVADPVNMSRFSEHYGPWGVVAGASAGLGAAFARALAGRGVNVLAIARRGDLLDELTSQLRRAHGVEARGLALDLAEPDAASALARATEGLAVGVAIYNAAFAPIGELAEQPLDDLLRVVDVNVRGPLVFAHTMARPMVAAKRGALVLMSSLAGAQGTPRLAAYAASKAFNTVLAEGLWHELGQHGVHVIASCAGAIRTPGYAKAADREAPGTLDADVIARRTLDAIGRGPRVVPGLTNRVASAVMGRLLPRRLAVHIMARSTRGLS